MITLTKIGKMIRVEAEGEETQILHPSQIAFTPTENGVSVIAGDEVYTVPYTEITIVEDQITDEDDFNEKLVALFSEEGGGSGETPGIDDVLNVDQVVKDGDNNTMMWFSKLGNRVQLEMVSTDEEDSGYAAIEPGQFRVGPDNIDYAVIKADEVEGTTEFQLPAGGGKILTDATQPKEYIAILSQEGTDAPTATIIKDDFGDVTYSYNDAGRFSAVSAGSQFTVGKTEAWVTNNYMGLNGFFINTTPVNASTVAIESGKYGDAPANGIIGIVQTVEADVIINVFHITVYP